MWGSGGVANKHVCSAYSSTAFQQFLTIQSLSSSRPTRVIFKWPQRNTQAFHAFTPCQSHCVISLQEASHCCRVEPQGMLTGKNYGYVVACHSDFNTDDYATISSSRVTSNTLLQGSLVTRRSDNRIHKQDTILQGSRVTRRSDNRIHREHTPTATLRQ
jgi:hypothetical protein